MISVLAVSVSATVAVRESLKTQYYDQLAQVAGDAGVAYAKACIAASGTNKPLWTNPLTPNTDCSGNSVLGYPQYVTKIGNTVQSSFSIPVLTGTSYVDANGVALTIPNTGYVQLLRTSNGAVWRTYNQPNAQASVVPDLCSGTATSVLGWQAAVATSSTGASFDSNALPISIATGNVNPGPIYFRKDFSVVTAGTYAVTFTGDDAAETYIDNSFVGSVVIGSNTTVSVNLTPGCHTIQSRLVNNGLVSNPASYAFSMKQSGASSALVVSDTTWRVDAGPTVNFSSPGYYEDAGSWGLTADLGVGVTQNSGWSSIDSGARYIAPINTADGNFTGAQYTLLRDEQGFTLAASTSVTLSSMCDDNCVVYINGVAYITNTPWSSISNATFTLPAGAYRVGVVLYNGGPAANPTGATIAVRNTSSGAVLTHTTTPTWSAYKWWDPSSSFTGNSYSTYFVPSPNASAVPKFVPISLLLVGGGGGGGENGGGGGGAGGAEKIFEYPLKVGTWTVSVGGGGGGGASGSNGGNSSVMEFTASGGGLGGSRTQSDTNSRAGGSGGGGAAGYNGGPAGASTWVQASAVLGQGSFGGNGTSPDQSCSAAGGGGGGSSGRGTTGATDSGGTGGSGLLSTITGSGVYYASGGAGGAACNGHFGSVAAGGGASNGSTPTATPNTGGGGAGASGSGCTGSCGAGSGATGVVIISVPASTASITVTGSVSTTPISGYTVYKFTGNGTFTVNSINP